MIWKLLAILLPAGIIIARASIPKELSQSLLQPEHNISFPKIIKTTETKNYKVAIRESADGSKFQLEWINKSILQYPTATIYAGVGIKDFKAAKLIGRIEARGNWYFPLDSTFNKNSGNKDQFTVYDFIHQQVIDTLNLKP